MSPMPDDGPHNQHLVHPLPTVSIAAEQDALSPYALLPYALLPNALLPSALDSRSYILMLLCKLTVLASSLKFAV